MIWTNVKTALETLSTEGVDRAEVGIIKAYWDNSVIKIEVQTDRKQLKELIKE